jgi:hypothetical protein
MNATDVAQTLEKAKDATAVFVARAAAATEGREAADWALAARNMASTVNSLGHANTIRARP